MCAKSSCYHVDCVRKGLIDIKIEIQKLEKNVVLRLIGRWHLILNPYPSSDDNDLYVCD